jgi:hypothetical protein
MLLEDARDQNLPAMQVAQKVEAEMPELAPVAAVLRGRRVDLKWWLMFVLAIIAILVAHLDATSAPSATDMEHAVEQALREVGRPGTPPPAADVGPRHVAHTPGRNDPCWCGSGAKYKRCHGR